MAGLAAAGVTTAVGVGSKQHSDMNMIGSAQEVCWNVHGNTSKRALTGLTFMASQELGCEQESPYRLSPELQRIFAHASNEPRPQP